MKIRLPHNSLVVLVGPSGSGKSFFAAKHFKPEEIISSDACRRQLAGDGEGRWTPSKQLQNYSDGAFVMFYACIRARLRHNLLAVADSTALKREYRETLEQIAKEEHVPLAYIYFETSKTKCLEQDAARPAHMRVGADVIERQFKTLGRSRGFLRTDDSVYTVKYGEDVEFVRTERDFAIDAPAMDVIGDVHGCYDSLIEMVEKLGYVNGGWTENEPRYYRHPQDRKLVFVGDLIDRGPEPYKCLEFVQRHVAMGVAYLVLSNHEKKLRGYLSGRNVKIKEEFQKTIDAIPSNVDKVALKGFLHKLPPYRVWTSPTDGQKWVVTHAAFDPKFIGKSDGEIEAFCIYGPVRSVDPVTHRPDRIDWAADYPKYGPRVVYGHQVVGKEPRVVNGTFGIDTGCVYGGNLTALRLPEQEFVQVAAKQAYAVWETEEGGGVPAKAEAAPTADFEFLKEPVVRVKGIDGRDQPIYLRGRLWDAINQLTTRTVSPEKLVWLAPTMSPGPVSQDPSLMEDPVTSARWLMANAPGAAIMAQAKHMGSRGTWLCERRDGRWEITCWTKNGYEMFDEPNRTQVYAAMQSPVTMIAERLGNPDRLLLDGEVMPWNQHGDAWLERTFMATAAAGLISREAMRSAAKRTGLDDLAQRYAKQRDALSHFGRVANQYCWKVAGAEGIRVGFFDVLLPQVALTHFERIRLFSDVAKQFPIVRSTLSVMVHGEHDLEALRAFWEKLTALEGVEGVVLKYNDPKQWSVGYKYPQRQLKVRGRDYLRIVYGPNYLEPETLARLRADRREDGKMRMAYQESLLGDEALRRFAAGEPFERWHAPVVGILAADKAAVDPRL